MSRDCEGGGSGVTVRAKVKEGTRLKGELRVRVRVKYWVDFGVTVARTG